MTSEATSAFRSRGPGGADEGAHRGEEQHRGDHEPPVRGRQHHVRRVDEPRARLGDPREQRVERGEEQVRGEAAGDAGEPRRQTGDRVPPGGGEQHRAERYQHHQAGVGGERRVDAGEDERRGEQPRRHDGDELPEHRRDEAASLGDADAAEHREHRGERRERREDLHGVAEHAAKAVGREQAHRRAPRAGARVRHREAGGGGEVRGDEDGGAEDHEQGERIREPVPEPLHEIQRAVQPGSPLPHGATLSHRRDPRAAPS